MTALLCGGLQVNVEEDGLMTLVNGVSSLSAGRVVREPPVIVQLITSRRHQSVVLITYDVYFHLFRAIVSFHRSALLYYPSNSIRPRLSYDCSFGARPFRVSAPKI